jgi:hypothetical protein
MTGRGTPAPPGVGIGAFVGIGGGIGLIVTMLISADFGLGVVFGACGGLLIGLMLEVLLAARAGRPGQG